MIMLKDPWPANETKPSDTGQHCRMLWDFIVPRKRYPVPNAGELHQNITWPYTCFRVITMFVSLYASILHLWKWCRMWCDLSQPSPIIQRTFFQMLCGFSKCILGNSIVAFVWFAWILKWSPPWLSSIKSTLTQTATNPADCEEYYCSGQCHMSDGQDPSNFLELQAMFK